MAGLPLIRQTGRQSRETHVNSGKLLADLRHEAGSRFDEAGMPIAYVSTMLGHSNLSTTSPGT